MNLPSDKYSDTNAELQQLRIGHSDRRFRQVNDLLIGHTEGSLQYLLAVNGGGAVAMLGLVGAVEKWRVQNWPYWVLATFVVGLIFAGIARAAILIHCQILVLGWLRDTRDYFSNSLEWRAVLANDQDRVKVVRWLPWTLGFVSLTCFIGGTLASGYLFFTLR
ncbi:MAG: hypothetical protein V4625_08220 [Pseudomonadota bacterium]